MSDTDRPSRLPEITPAMIYQAIMTVADGQQELRSMLLESEETLRNRVTLLDTKVDELKAATEAADKDHADQIATLRRRYHDLSNRVTPLFTEMEALRRDVDRMKTEPSPPPTADG